MLAANNPLFAANPAWTGFAIVPNWRLKPDDELVAKLMAASVRFSSS
jgi:hypothetical protein